MKSTVKLEAPIIIDTREQTPWRFDGYETIRRKLDVGDYSLIGEETRIVIERKSLPDFVSCVGKQRARFERELERIKKLDCISWLIIEGTLDDVVNRNYPGLVHPASIMGSLVSWSRDFDIRPWLGGPPLLCERLALRIFQDHERSLAKAIV